MAMDSPIMAQLGAKPYELKFTPSPVKMEVEFTTGTGQKSTEKQENKAEKSGAPMEVKLPLTDTASKAPENAEDDAVNKVAPNNPKKVEVLNTALAKTEKWFGKITQTVNHGRVVLLLPATLSICPNCQNIALTEDIGQFGSCHYCHDSSAIIQRG